MSVWLSDIGFQGNRFGSWMSVGRQANWKDETGDSNGKKGRGMYGWFEPTRISPHLGVEVGKP